MLYLFGGGGSMVSIETLLPARWSRVQILVGAKDFSLLHNFHTSWGVHPAFYLICTRVLSWDSRGWGGRLTTVLRFESVAIPLLHLHAFKTWTGKA